MSHAKTINPEHIIRLSTLITWDRLYELTLNNDSKTEALVDKLLVLEKEFFLTLGPIEQEIVSELAAVIKHFNRGYYNGTRDLSIYEDLIAISYRYLDEKVGTWLGFADEASKFTICCFYYRAWKSLNMVINDICESPEKRLFESDLLPALKSIVIKLNQLRNAHWPGVEDWSYHPGLVGYLKEKDFPNSELEALNVGT